MTWVGNSDEAGGGVEKGIKRSENCKSGKTVRRLIVDVAKT